MKNSVDVSVILVNYNTKYLLKQCMSSLYEKVQGLTYEIIVSDNDSQDGSIEMLNTEFPEVILLENKKNLGFGRANNVAIKEAKGKYIFLLNSDTYLINNALEIMFIYMENPENNKVACCGGDLFNEDGTRQASFGNFPSLFDAISQLGFLKLYKKYYLKYVSGGVLNYDQNIKEVDYVCGADMFLRKSIMDKVGYFDEDFFLYFEETEMSYRIKKAGYKSILIPEAQIVHLEGGSQNSLKLNFFKITHFSKSRKIYFEKTSGKLKVFLVKFLFVLQSLIFCFLKRNLDYLKIAKINIKA